MAAICGVATRRCRPQRPRLREDHGALAVQSLILQTLGRDVVAHGVYAGDPVSVRQYLADLAAVGGRILGYADLSDLEDLSSRRPSRRLSLRDDESPFAGASRRIARRHRGGDGSRCRAGGRRSQLSRHRGLPAGS